MNLHIDATVFCDDGQCGSLAAVIVHPRTGEVTHLVVREKHSHHSLDKQSIQELATQVTA